MANIDARKNAARIDGQSGVVFTQDTAAPTRNSTASQSAPTQKHLSESDVYRVKLATLRARQYDAEHGTHTRVYTTFVDVACEERRNDKMIKYTRRTVEIHTVREAAPIPEAVEAAPIRIPATRIRQDRGAVEAARARMQALEAREVARNG